MTLDHLDMAIAFAVVMLTVSLLVTIFVQTASAVLGLRGTNLRWGVEQVLRIVHPQLGDHAAALADRVLQHPVISDAATSRFAAARRLPVVGRWIARLHYASAIRVEELVGIMAVLAGDTPAPVSLAAATTDEQRMAHIVEAACRTTLAPAGLQRWDLRAWFDATMDRVSQRFVTHLRLWTIACSIAVALALHLDTFHLLSQLASGADARARLASASEAIQRTADATGAAPAAGGAYQADLRRLADQAQTLTGLLQDSGFQLVPDPYHTWDLSPWYPAPIWAGWHLRTLTNVGRAALLTRPANLHFWGILFSAGLLSLGAPFWYNALKGLSALKPIVADREQQERRTTMPQTPAG